MCTLQGTILTDQYSYPLYSAEEKEERDCPVISGNPLEEQEYLFKPIQSSLLSGKLGNDIYQDSVKIYLLTFRKDRDYLLKRLSFFAKIRDDEIKRPNENTVKAMREVIDSLPLTQISMPSLMIDPDGELALYWEDKSFYGELGIDAEGESYFFIDDKIHRELLSSREGRFGNNKTIILEKLRRFFSNGTEE